MNLNEMKPRSSGCTHQHAKVPRSAVVSLTSDCPDIWIISLKQLNISEKREQYQHQGCRER